MPLLHLRSKSRALLDSERGCTPLASLPYYESEGGGKGSHSKPFILWINEGEALEGRMVVLILWL